MTSVKAQQPFGQGHVGTHAQLYLRAWQGLNISPTFLSASRESRIVWKDILEGHMADGWCGYHLKGPHRGCKTVCCGLKSQGGLWLQKRVTKRPVPQRFHRITPVWLSLTLDQQLYALR